MGVRRVEIVHQEVEGVPELAANLENDNDLTTTTLMTMPTVFLCAFLFAPPAATLVALELGVFPPALAEDPPRLSGP